MDGKTREVVVIVDVQADFTEVRNGSLSVPGTDQSYVDEVAARTRTFKDKGFPIVATADHHPADHVSFFTNHPGAQPFDVKRIGDVEQVLWPPHCVQGTPGADLLIPEDLVTRLVQKGIHKDHDSYSGFRDDSGNETGLKSILQDMGATRLIVYGLATDVCVKHTVLHALEEGFDVDVVLSLCRGITPEGTDDAVKEMTQKGAAIAE